VFRTIDRDRRRIGFPRTPFPVGQLKSSGEDLRTSLRRTSPLSRVWLPRRSGAHHDPLVLISRNPLSTLQKRFACARLSRPCVPETLSRPFPRRSPPRLFDRSSSRWFGISDLITEPEGPSFISRTVTQLRTAVWTSDSRDTRLYAENAVSDGLDGR
jgi:hypothetical protein